MGSYGQVLIKGKDRYRGACRTPSLSCNGLQGTKELGVKVKTFYSALQAHTLQASLILLSFVNNPSLFNVSKLISETPIVSYPHVPAAHF